MATLAADMDASQAWVPLADPDGLVSGFYTIDDENIRVRDELHRTSDDDASLSGRVDMADGRFVERGIAGTTPAAHSSGATMTRYYPDAVSSGIAGTQVITTLGPFSVTAANLPANGDYLHLADLDVGVLLVDVFAFVVGDFASGVTIGVALSKPGAPATSAQFGTHAIIVDDDGASIPFYTQDARSVQPLGSTLISAAVELVAYLDAGTLDALGSADFYAYVVEPS